MSRKLFAAGIISGALLLFAPSATAIVRLIHIFVELGQKGIADPRVLSARISGTFVFTPVVVVLFSLGVLISSLSLVFFFRRPKVKPPALPKAPTGPDANGA